MVIMKCACCGVGVGIKCGCPWRPEQVWITWSQNNRHCICELMNVGYGIRTPYLYRIVTTVRYWSLSVGPFE